MDQITVIFPKSDLVKVSLVSRRATTVFMCLVVLTVLWGSGCARRGIGRGLSAGEKVEDQIDAAQKVVGAMGNRQLTRQELEAVARDIQKNPESRSAAQKIMGVSQEKTIIKYSPVTGKHYSGDLEFDPETGAKLEIIEE